MENKEIRKLNLERLLEQKRIDSGLNKAQFAEKCGISPATLSQMLGDNPNRNVGDKMARKIESSFSMPNGWMDTLHQPTDNSNVKFVGDYKPGRRYPVLSSVQAGSWCEACEPYTLRDIDLWLESDAHIQGEAFWLEVEGDSMTAPVGLSVPEGTFVLFDTGREPVNGSLVIAKLSDSNEATFKKLIIDGGQKYLKGLNPAWPLVPINGNCKTIGVAVETKLRLI